MGISGRSRRGAVGPAPTSGQTLSSLSLQVLVPHPKVGGQGTRHSCPASWQQSHTGVQGPDTLSGAVPTLDRAEPHPLAGWLGLLHTRRHPARCPHHLALPGRG